MRVHYLRWSCLFYPDITRLSHGSMSDYVCVLRKSLALSGSFVSHVRTSGDSNGNQLLGRSHPQPSCALIGWGLAGCALIGCCGSVPLSVIGLCLYANAVECLFRVSFSAGHCKSNQSYRIYNVRSFLYCLQQIRQIKVKGKKLIKTKLFWKLSIFASYLTIRLLKIDIFIFIVINGNIFKLWVSQIFFFF